MSEEYIKPGRILIALQIILVPLYFFILANFFKTIDLPFIPNTLASLFVRIISPISLSLPIVLFSYFQRYEISEAYEHMGETVWNLPSSIKAFYGFNFFLVIAFGLPFIAPIISLSGGYFIGLVLFKKKEDMVQISRPLIKFSTIIYIPIGLFIGILFYYQIEPFFNSLVKLWGDNINFLYLSSLNIANGALISGLLFAVFDYLEKNSLTFEKPNFLNAIIGVFVFVGLEVILIYFYNSTPDHIITGTHQLIFSIVNIVGFFLSLILIVLRWLTRSDYEETGTGLVGWITIFAFQLVNLLSQGNYAILSQTTAIVITSLIFILLFISSYVKATKYI
jgi:hypothetical protein